MRDTHNDGNCSLTVEHRVVASDSGGSTPLSYPYIAGIVDGEGSIGKKSITISNTNKEVLDRIQETLKCGKVYTCGERKSHWKQSWVYAIAVREHRLVVLKSLLPFLIIKKDTAIQSISRIEKSLRGENYRNATRLKEWSKLVVLRESGMTYQQMADAVDRDRGAVRRSYLRALKHV